MQTRTVTVLPYAAKLARDHASVGESQRARFRVVMLDEYQDTGHAQRMLLASLFGGPAGAAAAIVGRAIYEGAIDLAQVLAC